MLVNRPLQVNGGYWGTIYTFEKAGDVFATHVHTEETNHITIVLFGSIRCSGHPKYEGAVIEAKPGGTIVNWIAGEPHGFIAIVDGTTILNMPKERR